MKKKWKTGKVIRTSDIERFTNLPIKVVSPEEICYNDLESGKVYYILEIDGSYYFDYTWKFDLNDYPPYSLWTEIGDNSYIAYSSQSKFVNANELVS